MKLLGINNKLQNAVIATCLLFIPFILTGQKDTTLFNEVTIKGKHLKVEEHTTLNEKQIEQLAPHDLGSLLQYINGLTIKNYGGIGGMKTLSHRGMGGEHTQLIVDGLPINDPQSGQTNLANIQLNNVEKVSLSHQNTQQLVPVSGLIKGSAVHLKTFNQKFSPHLLSVRSSATIGSFGQKEGYIGLKKGGKKSFISLSGGYRTYDGDYPYQLKFGKNEQKVTRKNNSLSDYNIAVGAGIKWRNNQWNHRLKFSGKRSVIDQELPGAVIFYNNMSRETLTTENNNAGIDYGLFSQNLSLNVFAQYQHRFTHYHDPNYLNADGFLDNQYTTHSMIGGFHLKYKWKDFTFHAGNDFGYDALQSSRNLGQPTRSTNTSMIKAKYQSNYFYVEASGFHQTFIDKNKTQTHQENYQKLHPQLSFFTSDQLFKDLQLFVWYKPSSRAPSFNELYYSQVGNTSLVPEESTQLNLGSRYIKSFNKLELQLQANVFKNRVDNKIIALPTQNLFVWSIQNIGKVDVLGGDIQLNATIPFNKNWKMSLQTGANYQRAIDISDETAPTYRDQIAYTPTFTGNAIASIFYKRAGIYLTGLYIGERYSLNENTKNNRLEPYLVFDLSASYSFPIKDKHVLKLHAGIKNINDASYSYIKHFVMPGRNYFLKLSYAFN